jgi:hypothetical protein
MTLVCQLLTAWTLKLPLWPSDLTDACLSGTLPFLGAANSYRTELEGHKYAFRAMRDPMLLTVNVLIARAQKFAASVKMVVPELNLGENFPLIHNFLLNHSLRMRWPALSCFAHRCCCNDAEGILFVPVLNLLVLILCLLLSFITLFVRTTGCQRTLQPLLYVFI